MSLSQLAILEALVALLCSLGQVLRGFICCLVSVLLEGCQCCCGCGGWVLKSSGVGVVSSLAQHEKGASGGT